MSDDKPPSRSPQKKGWFARVNQFLTGELQDKADVMEVLKEARQNKLMENETLTMIEGVLQVSEMRVRDVMIPRKKMVVLSKDAELTSIFPLVIDAAHSRFPVIAEDRSEVVGILLAKDVLKYALGNQSLKTEEIMRSASFVPESKRLNVLLKDFRTKRNHMAIVVDEYGTAAGLVTIEDVLEQIVGEIEDEYDQEEESYIQQRKEKEFIIKALTPIDDFNEYFSADLKDDEFDTMAGLIVHKMEHLPQKGEKFELGKFCFEVLRADNRQLHQLKLNIK